MRIIIKQKYISSKKILNESRYSRQLLCRAHVGRQHAGPFTGSKQLRPRLCSCWVMGPIIGLLFFFFLQLPRATAVQGGRLEDDCRSSVSHSKLLSYLSGLFCWGGKNAEEKKRLFCFTHRCIFAVPSLPLGSVPRFQFSLQKGKRRGDGKDIRGGAGGPVLPVQVL